MSLRGRLTAAVVGTLVLIGLGSAVLVYARALQESRSYLDDQLRQVAMLMIASSIADRETPVTRTDPDLDPENELSVTVWDVSGRRTYSNTPTIAPAYGARPGWFDETVGGVAYRVYRLADSDRVVAVAQAREVRDEAALASAAAAALPIALAIPILGLVVAYVIRRALAPLDSAAREVASRPSDALTPLSPIEVPGELRPFIAEIDRLLARLRETREHERLFLADAAHALRTPIAALSLQVDVLEGARNEAARGERLAEMKQGVARLRRLVDQLLVLARQDARERSSEVETCHLASALRNVLDLYAGPAAHRDVALSLVVDDDLQCRGNAADLVLAVGNLVDNAVRSSPTGGRVDIVTSVESVDVLIDVRDQGPGIPEHELARAFDRFYQGAQSPGGIGLGLATVRRLVEHHGGSVSLVNRAGGGLSACIRLQRRE